jgi:hybrid cluster-associated redox disulfide protein
MADLITKDMGIIDIVQKYPETARVLMSHGMGCLGCALAKYETLEQGAMAHGMNMDTLLKDLNETARKSEAEGRIE